MDPKFNAEEIGKELRQLRNRSGLHANQIATQMGVSKSYLSQLEVGKKPWSTELVAQFTQAIKQLKGNHV